MSARVDVLAVLDQAIERERNAGQPYVAQVAARAAVAELIEAAKVAKCTPCHSTGKLNVRPDRIGAGFVSCDPYPCPHCAPLRAALARIGGAA